MSYRPIHFSIIFTALFLALTHITASSIYADDLLPIPPLPRTCGHTATPLPDWEGPCCVSGYIKFGDTVLGGVRVQITAHNTTHTITTTVGTDNPYPRYSSLLSTLTPEVRVGDEVTITAQWQEFEASQTFTAQDGGQRIDIDLQSGPRGELTLLDQLGGVSNALTKQGNFVYMGEGPRLSIIDVSDPVDPRQVGRSDLMPGIVRDVAVADDVAYVAAAEAGLRTFDIRDPTDPGTVAVYALNASAFGVTVQDEFIYVGNGLDGVQIFTKTESAGLQWVAQFDTPGFTHKATVVDDLLYVADAGSGLIIADISDPTAPVKIGEIDTPGSARRVTVVGGTAYVADTTHGMRIINVSDPTQPQEVGFFDTDSSVTSIAVRGNRAYLADTYGDFLLVDISDPAAPNLLDSDPQHSRDVVIDGSQIYVGGVGGLVVLDAEKRAELSSIGSYNAIGFASSLAMIEKTLFVADWTNGLWSIDATAPTNLHANSFYPTERGTWDVSVFDTRAFLAAKQIEVLDLSDPTNPEPLIKDLYGDARDMVVGQSFGYVANGGEGLRVVAFSNNSVTQLQDIPTGGPAHHVHLHDGAVGDELYVADQNGLQLFELDNPTVPENPYRIPTQSWINAVDTQADLVVLAEGNNGPFNLDSATPGLRILTKERLSLSETPSYLATGYFTTTKTTLDVSLQGDRAYLAAGGLQIVDLSTPISPTLEASFAIPGGWGEKAEVAVVDDRVYVAAYEAGVYVFDHPRQDPPPPAPTSTEWSILIYAAADNDLDVWMGYKAQGMLSDLLGAGAQPGVRVAILYDGADVEDSVRYTLEADGSWVPEKLGELAMDHPDTLRDFVEWGLTNLPAEQTYLIIADHANGVQGIGLDMTSDADGKAFLTTSELRDALWQATQNAGRTIDLLHFDGCSFGLLENTSIAAGIADYVITSPNTGWGTFSYDVYRSLAGSAATPRQLAEEIAQQYADEVARYGYPYTIAVHEMEKFSAVRQAVDTLGKALVDYVLLDEDAHRTELRELRRGVQTYDSGDYRVDERDRYVDLVDLSRSLQTVEDSAITTAAQAVASKVSEFTFVEYHKSGSLPTEQNDLFVNLDGANGLGIYYPLSTQGTIFTDYTGHALFASFTSGSGWVSFLVEGVPALGGPTDDDTDTLLAPIQPAGQLMPEQEVYLPITVR